MNLDEQLKIIEARAERTVSLQLTFSQVEQVYSDSRALCRALRKAIEQRNILTHQREFTAPEIDYAKIQYDDAEIAAELPK